MKKLVLLLLLAAHLEAATWYIDSSATGAGNGTSRADAWTSFASIGTNAAAGDTIKVYKGSGTYARWTVAEGGTDANTRITVQGIDEGSGLPVSVGFNGAGFDYIAVIGMEFIHTSTATNYAFIAWNGAVGWLVQDCRFLTSYRDAITGTTSGNNSNIIRHCYFEDIGGIADGAAAGASGTSFINLNGNSNLIEYCWSTLGMDRLRLFGTGNVARNLHWGATDTTYYPASDPQPFHSDGLQSFEGTLPLVKLLLEKIFDADNRDTVGRASNAPNGHSFIVQDGGSNGFEWYLIRHNVFLRQADGGMIFRNVSTVRVYHNTIVQMKYDKTTTGNNAIEFESGGSMDDYDFRNNTFPFNPNCLDSGGLILNSNRPTNFTSGANHSYNATGGQSILPTGASPANLSQTDPLFVDGTGVAGHDDYRPSSSSPLRNAAAPITAAVGSGSASTSLTVVDAKRLFDGWGIADADKITIGAGAAVKIVSIDYPNNVVTLAEARDWDDEDDVFIAGSRDVGALSYGVGAPSVVNGSVSGLSGSVTLSATVADSANVRFVEFQVDGMPVGTDYEPSTNTYSSSWTGDGNGHTFTARAYAFHVGTVLSHEIEISLTGDAASVPVRSRPSAGNGVFGGL